MIGTEDGSILVADTLALDQLRGGSSVDPADAFAPVGLVQLDQPIRVLFAARDGSVAFVRSPDKDSIEILQKGSPLPPKEPWVSMPNSGKW